MAAVYLFSDPADLAAVNSLATSVGAPVGPLAVPVTGAKPASSANTLLVIGLIAAGVAVLAMPSGRRR